MTSRWVSIPAVAMALVAGLVACQQGAGRARGPSAAERGRLWYGAYCSDCHGATAHGNGPLARGMQPPPADLTAIAAREGRFDRDRVAARIDGREDVERHGTRGMPVWGRKLDDRMAALDQEMRLSPQVIAELVAFLESQQVAATP